VLDKENATARKGVFMIDASKGFIKDGNKNRLREQDIHRIVDTFTRQATPRATPHGAVRRDRRREERLQPQPAALHRQHRAGGPAGHRRPPARRHPRARPRCAGRLLAGAARRARRAVRIAAPRLRAPQAAAPEVKPAIFGHAEFTAFNRAATRRFADWRKAVTPQLTGFAQDGHPKALIETIAEDLLASFKEAPLLDAYDIYQHLMDYWAETMQDDAYLIAADGWVARTRRIVESDKKGKTRDKGWACDLIPKPSSSPATSPSEQAAIEAKQAELEAATASLAELEEEHGGEDAAFSGFDSITGQR
jgi:type I restriction enzyme M protein